MLLYWWTRKSSKINLNGKWKIDRNGQLEHPNARDLITSNKIIQMEIIMKTKWWQTEWVQWASLIFLEAAFNILAHCKIGEGNLKLLFRYISFLFIYFLLIKHFSCLYFNINFSSAFSPFSILNILSSNGIRQMSACSFEWVTHGHCFLRDTLKLK